MRQPLAPTFLRTLLIALALVFVSTSASPAFADDRTEARTHYQAGVKFYAGGDYRSAIREFSAAQQLAPADLNEYNLALCFDKLGDAEPAMQHYRAYLDRVPNTDKRAEIDASVARLDAAAKSAAAKKAEEMKRADLAKKAEEDRLAAEAAAKAAAAKKAEDARIAAEAKQQRQEDPDPMMPKNGVGGGGSTGTPSTGVVSTGDTQLDRVQNIDVNAVRDQRVGGGASGIPATNPRSPATGPAVAAAGGASTGPAVAAPTNGAAPNPAAADGTPMSGEPPKKEAPIYKKWWFWAVVAVSAYVVYQIASDDASSNTARVLPEVGGGKSTAAQPGGLTLMSW